MHIQILSKCHLLMYMYNSMQLCTDNYLKFIYKCLYLTSISKTGAKIFDLHKSTIFVRVKTMGRVVKRVMNKDLATQI